MNFRVRRLLIVGGVLLGIAFGISLVLVNYWQATQLPFKNTNKLMEALNAYTKELAKRQQPLPESISLEELVSGGFIEAKEVKAFQDVKVTFYPRAAREKPPGVLVRAQTPGGDELLLMADGSVQTHGPNADPTGR